MPNNALPDYIAPHWHSLNDITDFLPVVPISVVRVLSVAEATPLGVWEDVAGVVATITPPPSYPVWELTARLSGAVETVLANDLQVRLRQDDTTTLIGRRWGAAAHAIDPQPVVLWYTLTVPASVEVEIKAQWQIDDGGVRSPNPGGMTLSLGLRPYIPRVL